LVKKEKEEKRLGSGQGGFSKEGELCGGLLPACTKKTAILTVTGTRTRKGGGKSRKGPVLRRPSQTISFIEFGRA